MSKGYYKVVIMLSLFGIMVTYNNCGAPFGTPVSLNFGDTSKSHIGTSASYDTFKTTVYPITRSRCISCHTTQTPTSAHDDLNIAHDAIVDNHKVDFENPASSRLVKKLRDELHNCWGDCAANADEMQAAVTKWAQIFKQVVVNNPKIDEPIEISIKTEKSRSIASELADPANRSGNTRSITFDISPYLGFPNVYFMLDVSIYDDYSYKFSNPRIKTPTEKVHVKKVKVLINGKDDAQNRLYHVVDKTTATNDRVLSTSAMIALKDKGEDLDQVSISFEKLRLVTTQSQSYIAFEDSVYQVTRNNCSSCHSGTNPSGHAGQDPATAHDVVLTRSLVNFTTPANSTLYTKLRQGHNCGQQTDCNDLAEEMLMAIEEWKAKR